MSVLDIARAFADCRGLTRRQVIQKVRKLDQEVARLQRDAEKVAPLEARLDEQAMTINSLRGQLDNAKRIKDTVNAKAERFDEAEIRAGAAEQMLADQTAELYELRAFRDNATAITLPPAERDTTEVEDQATGPIDVRTLRDAAAAGLLSPIVQVATSGASANPGQPRRNGLGVDATLPLNKIREAS